MTTRYWVAVLGSWLGLPLMLAATVYAVTDTVPIGLRIFSCLGIFGLGWGGHYFVTVGEQEICKMPE